MTAELFATTLALAGVAGFGSGFIGIGGGLLLFPLLLYVPPILGLPALEAKSVAALVLSQVFFSGVVGGAAHWRKGRVHGKLALVAGGVSSISAFTSGILSRWVSDWVLLLVFGFITLLAGAVMFLPAPSAEIESSHIDEVVIPTLSVAAVALFVGGVVGLLGAGNFLFVPLLIYVLKVPTRISIGSSLVIYVANATSGILGKLLSGQIPLILTAAILIGASSGALIGEKCHTRASPKLLRLTYAGVIAVVSLRIWITILG